MSQVQWRNNKGSQLGKSVLANTEEGIHWKVVDFIYMIMFTKINFIIISTSIINLIVSIMIKIIIILIASCIIFYAQLVSRIILKKRQIDRQTWLEQLILIKNYWYWIIKCILKGAWSLCWTSIYSIYIFNPHIPNTNKMYKLCSINLQNSDTLLYTSHYKFTA